MMAVFLCDTHCKHDSGCQKPAEPAEVVALRERNAELEAALREIMTDACPCNVACNCAARHITTARRALKKTKK